ncbi:MAG: dihydrolipoyl dehydrogenase, partial [Myxococcota bacterium]
HHRTEVFEKILMAAGRRPNLGNLGLEHAGVKPDAKGRFAINPDTLQLGQHPIFVAGDVNELHPLLHEAADDGRLAGANAAKFPHIRAGIRRAPLGVVFSDPQIGIVGTGYEGLGSCQAMAGEIDYGNQGRARVQGINQGKVRIYAERHTGRLLGAELFGPRVEHMSHLLAWAVQQGLTVDQALAMPFYHPVVEEGLRTALRNLNANLLHGDPIRCSVTEMGVGA